MNLHVFLLVFFLIFSLALLCALCWPYHGPAQARAAAKIRSRLQRHLRPRCPDDCPACRLASTASSVVEPAPTPVRPWSEVKSRRGARHSGEHRGLCLSQPAVPVLRQHPSGEGIPSLLTCSENPCIIQQDEITNQLVDF
jgi:hypothetical protein